MAKSDVMFVQVLEDGSVVDKSFRHNLVLEFGYLYTLGGSNVKVERVHEDTYITRINSKGRRVYFKKLESNKSYLIAPMYIQELNQSPKEVRKLYNRLKETLGTPHFKISAKNSLIKPYEVRIHTWIDKGFNYKFTIDINESVVSTSITDEIYNLIEKTISKDLLAVLRYYDALNNNGISMTIDDEFFSIVDFVTEREVVAN